MLTNDLSNNNIPASAPPPPPPLPLGGLKNWTLPQDNGNSKKPSNVATSGISSRTEPKKGQSKSPVQQSSLNFAENPLFKKKQEEHNVNSETADEGSNIRQSEPNRGLTPKPVSPRVLSPQQDNGNSNKPSGTNNSTQSEKGLSENPIQLATEQKIDTPILVNTSVGISKATALKYSIATLLLCISSVTAGIYTYLSISVTLSDPVLFTVIASVSSLVVLSLAAYLINSHLSAINSEKKVDPGRKQSQYSELQKEAESLGHSNTPIPSLEMSGTPSAPPPPPPLPQNAAPLPPRPTASKCTEKPKNGAPKKANESEHDRSALLEQIRKGTKLKPINDGAPEKAIDSGIGNILKRRKGIEISSSESEVSDHSDSDDWSNDESKKPKEKKLTKSRKKPTPSNSQPEDERGSKSPDSGHDNIKPEPTTSKVEKPQVPTKPPNLRVSPQTSPAAQVKNVDPVNTSHSINSICELFGGKANKLQKQNVAKRY